MLNICYIVNDVTSKWFEFSIRQSLQIADRFIFVVDRPDQETWDRIQLAQDVKETIIIRRHYEKESKKADGIYRNHYLTWLKYNAEGEWALVLDDDEILGDDCLNLLNHLNEDFDCFNVKMRHLWYALSLEDATMNPHLVPRRLFKVQEGLSYPLVEHGTLQGANNIGNVLDVNIWHFNVVKGILAEVEKYKRTCAKSNIHNPEQLKIWHSWHVLGAPEILKHFNPIELPKIVRDYCCINDNGESELYVS